MFRRALVELSSILVLFFVFLESGGGCHPAGGRRKRAKYKENDDFRPKIMIFNLK